MGLRLARYIYKKAIRSARIVGKDIAATRKMPANLRNGWKEGAQIARNNNQSIFTGIKTRAKEATKKGVVPHLPGLTALTMCWIPLPGMTESGYFIGRWLKKILSRKLGLPL